MPSNLQSSPSICSAGQPPCACYYLSENKLKAKFLTTISTFNKYLALFLAFPDFSAEFPFTPARLSPSALPALQAKEFRQIHLLLFPIPCCIDFILMLLLKDTTVNDKWFIDCESYFLLPDEYTESLGCNFAWYISKYEVGCFARNWAMYFAPSLCNYEMIMQWKETAKPIFVSDTHLSRTERYP